MVQTYPGEPLRVTSAHQSPWAASLIQLPVGQRMLLASSVTQVPEQRLMMLGAISLLATVGWADVPDSIEHLLIVAANNVAHLAASATDSGEG